MGEALCRHDEIVSIDEAMKMAASEVEKHHSQYINPHFVALLKLLGLNKKFVRAEGTKVWDDKGREYIDFLGAYGALNIGHNNPEVINKLQKIISMPNLLQTTINPITAALAKNLALITPGDLKYTFFCNSGAEAVEGALKLAKIATGKSGIIYCKGSFHGKSMGALSVTGRDKYKKYFGPLVPLALEVPYGDLYELEKVIEGNNNISAFIVEPIQGEAGIITPPLHYLKKAKELCSKNNILFIADEVQTGLGRTGSWFACDDEGVVPDILCMAKALGGGIMPIGAYIANETTWKRGYGSIDKCLLHTSTFGGNTWACGAAIATIEAINNGELHKASKEKGEYFLSKLKMLKGKYPLLKDVRGRGLMIGLEFADMKLPLLNKLVSKDHKSTFEEYVGGMIASELSNEYQIITAYTLNNPNVIRVEPPLTISYTEIDYFIDSLEGILRRNKKLGGMAKQTIKNILHSFSNQREA